MPKGHNSGAVNQNEVCEIYMKFLLYCGCRRKCVIIAVNFPIKAIGRKKPDKYQASLKPWYFLACTFCFPISDHVMHSWEFAFCFCHNYAYICTCIRRHLKETILSSSITWSEIGKQNIQAKEVYCNAYFNSDKVQVLAKCCWHFASGTSTSQDWTSTSRPIENTGLQ